MKFFLAVFVICAVAYSQAQAPMGFYPGFPGQQAFAGVSPGQFYQTMILQKEAGKLLIRPDLPQDLRQRVLDIMTSAEQGLNKCNAPEATTGTGTGAATPTLPWMQIQCSALQMKLYKNQLKVIKNEANARAAAATAAMPSA
ncbi:uncharacterized protein LOC131800838 [Musca domestica]|uniref:Uncharacterized protein LOC101890134 n=1 Tax=Musca domestica TaxID=7370 RepID=A0A1I8NBN2_MUSDO|nr:uncharacterized protein LOC101890134 [Musca domestica]XP_058974615.1 uncharacterized protein LOC131800838 [Musca domestica]